LTIVYHLLADPNVSFSELGGDYFQAIFLANTARRTRGGFVYPEIGII